MRTLARAAMVSATLVFAFPCGVAFAAGALKAFVTTEPAAVLPEIALMSREAVPETLAETLPKGVPVVLNLWATWCPPCIAELPSLARMAALVAPDIHVVAVSVDRGGALAVGNFLEGNDITGLTIKLDPRGDSLRALSVRGMPTTLLLDADHREVARFEGPAEWDSAEVLAAVRARLLPKR